MLRKSWILALWLCLAPLCSAKNLPAKVNIYRPFFELSVGQVYAGTAFVITHQKRNVIVSAQHLIGEAGGLEKDYTGQDMKAIFQTVELASVQPSFRTLRSDAWVPVLNAASMTSKTLVNDVFFAEIKQGLDTTPLTLAEGAPKVGDAVYLFAEVAGAEGLLHEAKVAVSDGQELVYTLKNKGISLRATSGAPVLNAAYQVVAINLAGGHSIFGGMYGKGLPVSVMKKHLDQALGL